jgi:hypothetical protein
MFVCGNSDVYHFPLQFRKHNCYQHDTNKELVMARLRVLLQVAWYQQCHRE